VAARTLRYQWFYKLLENSTTGNDPIKYILTAHHLDDNIETVLMNFFKGTGITGLRGIEARHEKIVRPLLFASKKEIKNYADENGLQWVEDSSNESIKYTRNLFRNEIIPSIEKVYPSVMKNLSANIERAKDAEVLYRQAIDAHKKKILACKGNDVLIPVLKLQKSEPIRTITYEIIKDYGFSSHQVDEVLKLLESESGKYILSATHRILRNRAWLIISPIKEEEQAIILIEKDGEVKFEKGKLSVKQVAQAEISSDPNTALINAKEITFPLFLRRWKEGDYFYPLGMQKKKKLARFFIDQKLSLLEKEKAWVIESNKKIVWVVGYRIDDRFKITDQTKQFLQLKIKN
jgi:tRNA(Ile)-lysidine synthase